jgi:hypothetical protein
MQTTVERPAEFTWLACAFLVVSAFFALIGGIMAFNRRRFGGILLLIAAAACLPAKTYVYGGIFLAAGLLAFFCRRPSGEEDEDFDGEYDEDEDYSDDEDGYDDEEEFEEFGEDADESAPRQRGGGDARAVPAGRKHKERAAGIRENKETYRPRGDDRLSKLNEPVRIRSSKVCPVCGASVGIEHKFCYSCGEELHTTARPAQTSDEGPSFGETPVTVVRNADSPHSPPFPEEGIRPESPSYADGPGASTASEPTEPPPRAYSRPGEEERFEREEFREERKEDEEDDFSDEEDLLPGNASGHVQISSPNKVFVKPISDEHAIPKRPISINPDNSYQVFSNYTRRRKRRRHSLLRRVLGMFFLLLAVGGTAWFLLGLRKVPEEGLPVSIPGNPLLTGEPTDEPSSNDIVAVPNGISDRPGDILAALRVDVPSRGIVTGSNVNIRPDHSTAGAVVAKLNQGERTEVLDQWRGVSGSLSGTWYRIRFTGTGAGREGWIYGQYLQPLDARAATLPAGYTAVLLKTFGSGRAELTSHLGQPTRQTPTTLTWSGLTANVRGDGEVSRLQITSAKHVLQNGVAVGITDEMLYRNVGYPSEYRSGLLLYLESANQGMSVQLRNGKVQSVTVGNI